MVGTDIPNVRQVVAQFGQTRGRANQLATSTQGVPVARRAPFGYDALQSENPAILVERDALAALLQTPQFVASTFDTLPPDTFTHPALAWMHAIVQQAGGQAAAAQLGPKLWIQQVEDKANPAIRPLLSLLAISALPVADESQMAAYVNEVMANLQVQHLDRQIAAAKGRLSRAEANGSGFAEATIEIQQLETARRALLN